MTPNKLRSLKQPVFLLLLSGLTALAMVACATAADAPVAEETAAAPAATPLPLATAADVIPSNPQPSIITLTFWAVEQFSPQVDLVAQQIARFEAANPNVKVKVFLKKPTGQAGILNYLASASKVAPGVLPDVVVLSTDQLPQAWRNDLIQPLTGKLDRTITQDLLPAARQLGTVDGELAGIPFQMDVEHLVYNTTEITPTPILWTDVLSGSVPYRFPAKGQNGLLNDASLIQYLAAGASLTDPAGNLTLDEAALRALLTFYQSAVERGILDPQVLDIGQTADLWAQYVVQPDGMVHTTAHYYLTDRRLLTAVAPAPIPSRTGEPLTIGHGWAFAMVTKDPTRQNHALKLIETFLQTDINAAWATRSAVIPTRRAAFSLVAGDDPYWAFLDTYLETAIPPPSIAGFDKLSRILQQAILQVIGGEATPEEAAQTAANAFKQP